MTKEEIDNRIKEIEPKTKKWKHTVGVSAAGTIFLFGLIFCIASAVTHYFLTFIYIFVPCLLLGLIYLIIEIPALSSSIKYKEEYDNLIRERSSLDEKENNSEDKNEDTLLRLLSEGKITTKEYKQLSNKETK